MFLLLALPLLLKFFFHLTVKPFEENSCDLTVEWFQGKEFCSFASLFHLQTIGSADYAVCCGNYLCFIHFTYRNSEVDQSLKLQKNYNYKVSLRVIIHRLSEDEI